MRSRRTTAIAVSVLATAVLVVGLLGLSLRGQGVSAASAASGYATTSPIKHLVVIFQENVSFDHYFGSYPVAVNPAGEPRFEAAPGTPSVNGLTGALLTNNPNAANPQRLDRSQAVTCDQDHGYTDEQKSFVDLSPWLKAGDSPAEHCRPDMLTPRGDAVTGLHVRWTLGCRVRSTGVDSRRPCGMRAV